MSISSYGIQLLKKLLPSVRKETVGQAERAVTKDAVRVLGRDVATRGPRETFINTLVDFSRRYANQVEADHAAFLRALKDDPLLARAATRAAR